MTIKEFSDKYGIPYHIAYEASYKVQPVGTFIRDKDFPEDLLFAETKRIVQKRAKKHMELMNACLRAEMNMNNRRLEGKRT